MCYLGIDWAKDKHDLCLLADDGRLLSTFTIPNNLAGLQQMQQILDSLDNVKANLERSDGLLVDWLLSQQVAVYTTPPVAVARRRPGRRKDDFGDAYQLADMLRAQDPSCHPLARSSETVHHLQQLIRAYDIIVRDLRAATVRLTWILSQYYPTLLEAFPRRDSLISLTFLEAFPTPEAARRLTQSDLVQFLREHHYSQTQRLKQIYAALQTTAPASAFAAGYTEAALLLVPRIRLLVAQRKATHQRIVAVYNTHPEAAWWKGFPGASADLTPARLLAAIGDNRQRFPSAPALQATAGTVPITRKSGKKRHVEFRNACSKPLRRAVSDLARYSLARSGWAQAYFYQQLARGHSRSRAYRALGNRWLSVIWKLWQTGESYDEARHVANRERRNHPLPA